MIALNFLSSLVLFVMKHYIVIIIIARFYSLTIVAHWPLLRSDSNSYSCHGKVPLMVRKQMVAFAGVLDFVEDCGFGVRTH